MRTKIVGFFSVILILLSLLAILLLDELGPNQAEHQATVRLGTQRAAVAAVHDIKLKMSELSLLARQAADDPLIIRALELGTAKARGDAASSATEQWLSKANSPIGPIPFALLIDDESRAVGRNRTAQMREDDLSEECPALKTVLADGKGRIEVWKSRATGEQQLLAYEAIYRESTIIGVLALGIPLNEGLVESISADTSGIGLAIVETKGVTRVLANTPGQSSVVLQPEFNWGQLLSKTAVSERALIDGEDSILFGMNRILGLGPNDIAVVAYQQTSRDEFQGIKWVIGGLLLIGLIMVYIAATVLSNYIQRPVDDLEEGLLAIMNGDHSIRFDLDHEVLEGLVSRINALLNVLVGEPSTEAEDEVER